MSIGMGSGPICKLKLIELSQINLDSALLTYDQGAWQGAKLLTLEEVDQSIHIQSATATTMHYLVFLMAVQMLNVQVNSVCQVLVT